MLVTAIVLASLGALMLVILLGVLIYAYIDGYNDRRNRDMYFGDWEWRITAYAYDKGYKRAERKAEKRKHWGEVYSKRYKTAKTAERDERDRIAKINGG